MAADAKVFISYRREDTAGHAGRLYDRLKARFPGRVFMDVGEIAPGSDFVEAIERGVGECKALVAIIGNGWLYEDRVRDPNDFVRLEIATALKRGIRVVPVLVRGAHMPTPADLPEDLASLLRRQAISISDEDWESGCERLIQALSQDLGLAEKPATGRRRLLILSAAGIVAVAGGALLVRSYWPGGTSPPSPGSTLPVVDIGTQSKAAGDYSKALGNSYSAATSKLDEISRKISGEDKPGLNPVGVWELKKQGAILNLKKPRRWRFLNDRTLLDRLNENIGAWEYGDPQTVIIKLSKVFQGIPPEMRIVSTGPRAMTGKGSDGSVWDWTKCEPCEP
jgi:hypothetical protein